MKTLLRYLLNQFDKTFSPIWTLMLVLVFSTTATAQIKPADIILQFISGSADGVNQAVIHHNYNAGNKFWDAKTSWKNKYKNWPEDKREKFPGSKTVFVFLTDAFHLSRFIDRSTMTASIVLATNNVKSWKVAVKKAIILTIINRIGFSLFYNVIFKPK